MKSWIPLLLIGIMYLLTEGGVQAQNRKRSRKKERNNSKITPLISPPPQSVVVEGEFSNILDENEVEHEPGIYQNRSPFTIVNTSHSEIASQEQFSPGQQPFTQLGQMQSVLLLLQRISDRLTVFETLNNQRAERMDSIHYRITRMELQAEERKSVLADMNNNVRHRMEATDFELERNGEMLDEIKTAIAGLDLRHTDLKQAVTSIKDNNGDSDGRSGGTNRLQQIMATLYAVRGLTQDVQEDINKVATNLTGLNNVSNHMVLLSNNLVTKQYLRQVLQEQSRSGSDQTLPIGLLTQMLMQPRARSMAGPRTQQGHKSNKSSKASKARSKSRNNSEQTTYTIMEREKDPEDCFEAQKMGNNESGVYRVQPRLATEPFFVYCDMETDGGGWTVIQRREDGTVDFLREWGDYKHGFGNLAGEFWLGNEKIHILTNQYVSELHIDLADFDQQEAKAHYAAFAMGSEVEGYALKMLGKYTGTAGNSLHYHVGQRWSTVDVDNDAWPESNCARDHEGGWWYRACDTVNLNGRYLHGPVPLDHEYKGMYWYDFRGPAYSLWRSRIMIRRGGVVRSPIFKDFKEVKQNATPKPAMVEESSQPERSQENSSNERYTGTSEDPNPVADPYATYDYPYDPYAY